MRKIPILLSSRQCEKMSNIVAFIAIILAVILNGHYLALSLIFFAGLLAEIFFHKTISRIHAGYVENLDKEVLIENESKRNGPKVMIMVFSAALIYQLFLVLASI